MGLVLNRKVGEKLLIGHSVTVQVSKVTKEGDTYRVKLYIEAPENVAIDREEIRQQKIKRV